VRLFGSTRWSAAAFLRLAKSITRPWLAPVRALRAELGLAPGRDPLYEGQFSPFGTLALFSRVLARPQPDWPPRTTLTGFIFYTPPRTLPGDVGEFLDAGEPPIVFTLGSSATGAPGVFYDESLDAARRLGRRALLLVGRHTASTALASDGRALAVPFAPHDAVFPRAEAIVHHGGIGTTGQALRAGRPTLVVPHAHDQPDNALRVQRLGAARVLPAARYRSASAMRHLDALLSTPDYAARAQSAAATVRAEQGEDAACDAIEAAIRTGAAG
jgi:UDP:flavonoid glycosyltransferase YjiC (YdhE family)